MGSSMKEEIAYNGWNIDVTRQSGGWQALIYSPGAGRPEAKIPQGSNQEEVISEAKRLVDEWQTKGA
jgi:hypothetical protein